MENFNTITHEELKKWMDENKDFVLMDVLSPDSYNRAHLPGAKNVPIGDSSFLEKAEKLIPEKEGVVVVYCSSFSCHASPHAADTLVRAGYTNVYDFKGGLADWKYPYEGETEQK